MTSVTVDRSDGEEIEAARGGRAGGAQGVYLLTDICTCVCTYVCLYMQHTLHVCPVDPHLIRSMTAARRSAVEGKGRGRAQKRLQRGKLQRGKFQL